MSKVFDKIKSADWSGLKSVVSKGAPLLGSLLGGPVGGVAGTLLGSLFDTDGSDSKKLLAAISSDPEAMIKIQELESREKIRLQELVIESEKEYLVDRQNARAREASIVAATGKKDIALYFLAGIVVVGFFALFVAGIASVLAQKLWVTSLTSIIFGYLAILFLTHIFDRDKDIAVGFTAVVLLILAHAMRGHARRRRIARQSE